MSILPFVIDVSGSSFPSVPFEATPRSSASFSSIASLSFRALSFLNCFLSSRLFLVTSSAVSPATRPRLILSPSSQVGSLRLRLPLPKNPCSHSARIDASSVMWTDRVSGEKEPWYRVFGWDDGRMISCEK